MTVLPDRCANLRSIRWALVVFCFATFLLSFNARLGSVDGMVMYELTASLVDRQSIEISNSAWGAQGKDGKYYSKYGPLQSLLAIPLYAGGKIAASILGNRLHPTHLKTASVALFNPLVTALLALAVFNLGITTGLSRRRALLGSVLLIFATPFWTYSKGFFSEPLTTLLLVLAWEQCLLLVQSREPRQGWLAGLWFALAFLTRPLALVLCLPMLVYVMLGSRSWRAAVPVCVSLGIAGILLAAYNAMRFGSPLDMGYHGEGFTTPFFVGLLGLLVSPRCGILFYCPLLLGLVVAFPRFAARFRLESAAIAAMTGLWVALIACYWCWWGGGAWGPRYLLPIFPFLVFPIVYALPSASALHRSRWWWGVLLVALVAQQALPLSVTHARWEYGTKLLHAREGGDRLWEFRYMPLKWQAEAFLDVSSSRSWNGSHSIGLVEAAAVDPGDRYKTRELPNEDGLMDRPDMHMLDAWPAYAVSLGLPVLPIWAAFLVLFLLTLTALARLLTLLTRSRETTTAAGVPAAA